MTKTSTFINLYSKMTLTLLFMATFWCVFGPFLVLRGS